MTGLALVALAAVTVGCPIQRPPVPMDYFPFRDALRDSAAAIGHAAMSGRPAMQDRLEESLADLSTVTRTDSLFERLERDAVLSPLAGQLEGALEGTLRSDAASGGARKAFRRPEGQRLAVDAILIGLGMALRRLRVDREAAGAAEASISGQLPSLVRRARMCGLICARL